MITVTAVLLALVLPPKDPPQELIRSKGAGKSWIYLEKEGAVKVWDRSGSVNPGERIRVELLASSQQISYMGIINSQHDLISSPSTFVKNALSLEDGQRKAFADSFSLDENIEHESIFILSCPSSSPHGRDSIKDFLFEHKSNVRGIMASLEGCQTEVIRLR